MKFEIKSSFKITPEQEKSKNMLINGLKKRQSQVFLGATGTGKTFTIANVIQQLQKKTLILVHNKTLAGQLYSEIKELFPNNKVEYFVSNFDYYQPEAFLPALNLYIDKTSKQNLDLNILRMRSFSSLYDRQDTIVVASIASIFGAYSPNEYGKLTFTINIHDNFIRKNLIKKLVFMGYKRNDISVNPGNFKVVGDVFEIMQANTQNDVIQIDLFLNKINSIRKVNYLTKEVIETYKKFKLHPGMDYIFENERLKISIERISKELEERIDFYSKNNMFIEKQRINERVSQDLENLREFGICSGIENYSRHLDLREKAEEPPTLIDYFGKDWLLVIDESHITVPQIYGMYNADRSRKKTLVKYGFRLPSALDNRPLSFNEFRNKINKCIYVSATPGDYELGVVHNKIVEQIIRPTGLVDPKIEIINKHDQLAKIIIILRGLREKNERCLILSLTIRMAEEISEYLLGFGIKAQYLHNKLTTLERMVVLNNLRKGKIDVVVGINLLREGLDLPEVSTIIILDADKEGFLRNYRSLIQMFGRASRNVNGKVYLFTEKETNSIKKAINITNRRRKIQSAYNKKHSIRPATIIKPIINIPGEENFELEFIKNRKIKFTKKQKAKTIKQFRNEMLIAANNLEFEKATKLRDILIELDVELKFNK